MRGLYSLLAALMVSGCAAKNSENPPAMDASDAAKIYRDVFALYSGDQGIYRACGPNGGVCHNAREYPNLSSLGSILENIDQPCNQKKDNPAALDDLCERKGDTLRAGALATELGFVEPAGLAPGDDASTARTWKLHTADDLRGASLDGALRLERGTLVLFALEDYDVTATLDASDPGGKTLVLSLPGPPASMRQAPAEEGDEADDPGAYLAQRFAAAGVPGDPDSIQLGDPNQNGVYGATLGGRLIRPGDPANSYLMRRLIDPARGPLMPRANCCAWSKTSLRALYCWIAGMKQDGSNALDPIDYSNCPPGPEESVQYPEPGPACETAGLCPVRPLQDTPDTPAVGR